MGDLAPVAVILLTHNEARNVEACLRTVAGWCQEIHIVDSGSTDGTVELAQKYTRRIAHHPYTDHRSQLTWALETLPIGCPWVLLLDADHRVTQQLRDEMTRAMLRDEPGIDGYYNDHRVIFRQQSVRGFKERSLHLIRHGRARIDSSELVDFRIVVQGNTGYLPGVLIEENRNEDDIDFWIDKHQRFAVRTAVEEILRSQALLSWSRPASLLGDHDQRIIWMKQRWYRLPLYVRPLLYFGYRYFLRLGVLDGWNGLVFHLFQALWFRLLVDIRIGEIRRGLRSGHYDIEDLRSQYVGTTDATSNGGVSRESAA